MSIDIGCEAIDRPDSFGARNTLINMGNPANATGTINSIEIYAKSGYDLVGCKVGIFYITDIEPPSHYTLKCRSSATVGAVTSGSKQTFPVSLAVQTGDYIGTYSASGILEYTESDTGDEVCKQTNDHCTVGDETKYVITSTNATLSLYGGGYTVATPTVVTNDATSIGSFSAILNGEITDTGNADTDERGFDYGLTDSYGSEWAEEGTYGVASFHSHSDVDDLSPYTPYHFRAKAHNSAGWGYGEDETFTTLIARPLETHLTPTRLYDTTFAPEHLYEAKLTPERLYKATLEPKHLYEAELNAKLTETYKATLKAEHAYEGTLKPKHNYARTLEASHLYETKMEAEHKYTAKLEAK